MMRKLGAIIANNQKFLPLTATITLFFAAYTYGAISYEGMRDPQVFLNLFRANPFLLISAVGSTFVILSGGIDLSVSGVMALTSVASAALLREGWNPWAVMLLMLVMGMALGMVMGSFITYLKVQPFIATLAGMWFARGMCFFISDDAIPINDWIWRVLGQTRILIPGLADPVTKQGPFITPLVVLELVVLIAGIYIARSTRFGRAVYAIGGNEQSARLMGLPVNRTKMMVYTLNGFCSALAGITLSVYVMSGHGLYASAFEMTVIAAVVIGGTMLTGGEGYVFGTLFGVLITAVIQTLIQFNGRLSSWWTNIAVGLLTLIFIGVQSLLAARKSRQLAISRLLSQSKEGAAAVHKAGIPGRKQPLRRQLLLFGGSALAVVALVVVAVLAMRGTQDGAQGTATAAPSSASERCTMQLTRQNEASELMRDGAVIAYERSGGPDCITELYAVYPDGLIIGDDGTQKIEKQISPAEVEQVLLGIRDRGWFTDEMYSTWHVPCSQCFVYGLSISHQGQEKTVQAVDGGTDAPADYWQVVSIINGVIPRFPPAP